MKKLRPGSQNMQQRPPLASMAVNYAHKIYVTMMNKQ